MLMENQIVFFLIILFTVQASLLPCTSEQASTDGDFACFNDCDARTSYKGVPYCTTYLPNDKQCYLDSFDREKMLTCNGRSGPNDQNTWIVMVGGSNMFIMLKTMIDELLDIPSGTLHNIQKLWNESSNALNDREPAIMDFIWDADRKSVHRNAWNWEDCQYCLPQQVAIFTNVPKPTATGSFRISYVSLRFAADFTNRLDRVLSPNSSWLNTNPAIHIYMDWTGRWGDWNIGSEIHENNLRYLNQRQFTENLDIRTFVVSDSAFDCGGTSITKTNVMIAFNKVKTLFPKYYFSKSEMAKRQLEQSGMCWTDGHAKRPLDLVVIMRYFNIICPSKLVDNLATAVAPRKIPICIDLSQDQDFCFFSDGYWMSNVFYTCRARIRSIPNNFNLEICPFTPIDIPALPTCPAAKILISNQSETQINDGNVTLKNATTNAVTIIASDDDPLDIDSLILTAIAFFGSFCSILYLLYESWQMFVKQSTPPSKVHPANTTSKELSIAVQPSSANLGSVDIEMRGTEPNTEDSKENSPDNCKTRGVVRMNSYMKLQLNEDLISKSTNNNNPTDPKQKYVDRDSTSMVNLDQLVSLTKYFYFPAPIDNKNERFEAINFARYLASMHIVLGHMYQGGKLDSFSNFNKFGYTWVPWFFMLSGFILTTSETRRRHKREKNLVHTGENNGVNHREQLLPYILRRLETLYPTYLVGIAASIATIWAIQGPSKLPPPTNVLLSCVLLQSWVPSILEYGLVYLVQCWFLSCMLFYWCIFHPLFEYLHKWSTTAKESYILAVAFLCAVLIPLSYQLVTIPDSDWFEEHQYMSIEEGYDIATVTLKFHPLAYLHIFILGCTLPTVRAMIVRVIQDSQHQYHFAIKNILAPSMSILSYSAMIILFCTTAHEIPGYQLSLRLGLIAILQASLLVGLCVGEDLLCRLFNHPFFVVFGQYSFPQYVFQFIVQAWFLFVTKVDVVDIRYFALLFATSVIVWNAVKRFNGKNMITFVQLFTPFVVMYLMLQPFLANYQRTRNSSTNNSGDYSLVNNRSENTNTSTVVFPTWWQDTILNVTVANPEPSTRGGLSSRSIFNPSIFIDRKTNFSIILARRDAVFTDVFSWYTQGEYFQHRYETDILIAALPEFPFINSASNNSINLSSNRSEYSSLEISQWPLYRLPPRAFKPCVPEFSCSDNGTLTAKITTAPEDPRIVKLNGEYFATFFSYDNILSDPLQLTPDDRAMLAEDFLGDFGSQSKICRPASDGLIGRMHLAKIFSWPISPCSMGEFLPVSLEDVIFPTNSIVKNWLAFAYPPEEFIDRDLNSVGNQSLYFIHQIYPRFIVVKAETNVNAADQAVMTRVYSNTSTVDFIARLANQSQLTVQQQSTTTQPHSSPKTTTRIKHNSLTSTTQFIKQYQRKVNSRPCLTGFERSPSGKCLRLIIEERARYSLAVKTCQSLGGEIAEIQSIDDVRYLRERVRYFLTINTVYVSQKSRSEFITQSRECARLILDRTSTMKWFYDDCAMTLNYVCEEKSTVTPQIQLKQTNVKRWKLSSKYDNQVEDDGFCPKGYQLSPENHCYRLSQYSADYLDSVTSCESEYQGWLATIHSSVDNQFLTALVNATISESVYIGYNDLLTDGEFAWITSSSGNKNQSKSSYTNWLNGQPTYAENSNSDHNNHCVVLRTSGEWMNDDCLQEKYFICETAALRSPVVNQLIVSENMNHNPIHGNVNPVFISAESSPHLRFDYYLSIFHTISKPGDANHYASYAFSFCARSPFEINAVAEERLLLRTKPASEQVSSTNSSQCSVELAFVSGLTLDRCPWKNHDNNNNNNSNHSNNNIDYHNNSYNNLVNSNSFVNNNNNNHQKDISDAEKNQTHSNRSERLCLVLSYGVCDLESRVALIDLEEFEKTLTILRRCD